MDDLESRLNDGLSRHAKKLPRYDGNLSHVARRGRNRRWAVRSAGAFGAIALFGGGVALYAAATDATGFDVQAGDGGVAIIAPTPEPTPEPSPEPTPEPADAITPNEGDRPDPVELSLVVSTNWGVGLVGPTGDLYAPIRCCGEASTLTRNPMQARDDLRGGLVAATDTAVYWLPADDLAVGAEPGIVADALELDRSLEDEVSLSLWDVAAFSQEVAVLYSVDVASADGSGSSTLYALTLGADDESPAVLASSAWTEDGPLDAFTHAGAAWLPEGGHMALESAVFEPCEWIVFAGEGADEHSSPYPRPADPADCESDSLGAATLNDDGVLAVTHRYLSPTPELVVHDRRRNELFAWPLAAGTEAQGLWTELDMLGDQILVSRAGDMTLPDWPRLDETIRVDIAAEKGIGVWYWGNLTFPRADVATDALTALDPTSPQWFRTPDVLGDAVPRPTPEPTVAPVASITPGPTPTPEPAVTPTPDPTPVRPPIAPQARIPTGRLVDIKVSGRLVGDDSCLGGICVGQPIADALVVAESVYGPQGTAATEADVEGESPPPGEYVFTDDVVRVTITEENGFVLAHRLTPLENGVTTTITTVGDVLRTHGAPSVVFNGGGEGIQVLWLFYDTDAAYVGYGFTEYRGDEPSSLLPEGDLSLPESYDELPVNAYWAQPAG